MDQLANSLSNYGPVWTLIGMLFLLHVSTLGTFLWVIRALVRSFREELREERQQCHEDHERIETQLVEIRDRLPFSPRLHTPPRGA